MTRRNDRDDGGAGDERSILIHRRDFLKTSGSAVVAAGLGSSLLAACGGSGGGASSGKGLKILLWSHFVPRYDSWFDKYAANWGHANGVAVTVDHIDQADIPARTAAEISAGSGHDLIEWVSPASSLEPSVLDMSDVVREAETRFGKQVDFCKKSSFNPTTSKYYAFCHTWTPDPGDYRRSLWEKVGLPNGPTTWAELLAGGAAIKQRQGVRMGIGMSPEVDSNMAARAMIWSYGGSVQDANENVVLNSPEVVAAVEYMAKLYKQAMTAEVFSWTAASNNQGLIAGQLSYILNSISAYRTAQTTVPQTADDIFFVPALKGPTGNGIASEHVIRSYVIPKFSKRVDTAKKFLIDLVAHASDGVYNSELYDFPAFANTNAKSKLPGWLSTDPFGSHPSNKLALLASAESWSTNVGHPGPSNAAIGEVFGTFVLPNMMASVARGSATPKQAVASAQSQVEAIFAKWRKRGLVGGHS